MNKLKEILTSNRAKTFYWTVLNGFIGVFIVAIGDLNLVSTPVIIALLNGLSKYINNK